MLQLPVTQLTDETPFLQDDIHRIFSGYFFLDAYLLPKHRIKQKNKSIRVRRGHIAQKGNK